MIKQIAKERGAKQALRVAEVAGEIPLIRLAERLVGLASSEEEVKCRPTTSGPSHQSAARVKRAVMAVTVEAQTKGLDDAEDLATELANKLRAPLLLELVKEWRENELRHSEAEERKITKDHILRLRLGIVREAQTNGLERAMWLARRSGRAELMEMVEEFRRNERHRLEEEAKRRRQASAPRQREKRERHVRHPGRTAERRASGKLARHEQNRNRRAEEDRLRAAGMGAGKKR